MTRLKAFGRAFHKLSTQTGRLGPSLTPLEEEVMAEAIRLEAARNDPIRRRRRWAGMPSWIQRPVDFR